MYLPKLLRLSKLHNFVLLVTFTLLTLCLLLSAYYLLAPTASAQVPDPYVPCEDTDSPEFQTLRPYQASPCNEPPGSEPISPLALFCGNDLFLTDTITVFRNNAVNCTMISPNQEACFYRVRRNLDLAIDVSNAHLPIMGRTEGDVVNSRNQNETRNDAEKVNEYVSWYLAGVNPAAEYGALDEDNPADISKLKDFSGPIQRLLPERIKRDEIREVINEREATRHDQVIGCVRNNAIVPCYSGGGGNEIRLSDLAGHMPPLEEEPRFDNYEEFLRAYMEWRGWSCPNIPIVNISICFDNILVVNFWADLYYQTPLSSTEDRKGLIEVINPYVQPVQEDMEIVDVVIDTTPADLFFSHMVETRDLADTLQNTFVPKGNPKSGPVIGVSPAEYCDLTEIRTNPGDDLFAGEIGVDLAYTAEFSCIFNVNFPPEPINMYICGERYGGECVTDDYSCDTIDGQLDCPDGYRCGVGCTWQRPNPSCTRNAQVVLNTITETPMVDDIWSRLVAGTSAVFKRIFPKVEPGAPVEGILDIPAATGVTYRLNPPVPGVSLTAGNPGLRRGLAAELYFPHIGGIEQYFLQCIQTALRPQGFGEVCYSGVPPEESPSTCPSVPDSEIPGEWLGGFKQNFIGQANRWSAACPGPDNNMADECYNYVVRESINAGVNPAFVLTIWLNESDASNYCDGGPTTKDFGVFGVPVQNIIEQLTGFLTFPFDSRFTSCRNQTGWIENMHAFLNVFRTGGCENIRQDCQPEDDNPFSTGPTAGTCYYRMIRENAWRWVAGDACVSGGRFAIDWPTDNSCP